MDEIGKNKRTPLPPAQRGGESQNQRADLEISNPLGSEFTPDAAGTVAAPLPPGMYEDERSGWREKIREFFSDRRKLLIAGVVFILLLGAFVAFLLIRRGGPPASETPADNNGRLPIAGQTTPDLNPIVYRPGDGTLVVFWTTDRPTDGRVNYGLSQNYTYFADDQETLHPSRYATRHNVILRGLDSSQTYHLMASSLDGDGNLLFSNDITVRPIKDTVPPSVAFKTPSDNSNLSGVARACPSVSDDQGIYSVTFLVDGRPLTVRYENFNDCFEFDTSQFGNGNHTLGLFVSDGVNTTNATLNVNVDNPAAGNQSGTISVTITAPQNNQTISGQQTASAESSDSSGAAINRLEFIFDGVVLGEAASASGSFTFDTSLHLDGLHNIVFRARNEAGQFGLAMINVVIDNDGNSDSDGDGIPDDEDTNTGDPGDNTGGGGDVNGCTDLSTAIAVTLAQPQDGATLSGLANLEAQVTATGGKQISQVVFMLDLSPVRSVTASPYTSTFNTAFYPDGQHIIKAVAVATDGTCNDYSSDTGDHAATVTFDNFGPGSGGIFITNVQVVPTTNSLTVSWVTNQDTNSIIDYGLDQNYGQQAADNQYVTNHSITIPGLQSNTLYYLRLSGSTQNGTNVQPYQTFAQTLSTTTGGATEDCSNGVDDDGDGLVDGADPDCGNVNLPPGCTSVNPSIVVTITSPINGAVVAGNLDIITDVQAGTGISISKVVFLIDGQQFAEATNTPYVGTLTTTSYANGPYVVKAIAQGSNGECSDIDDEGPHIVAISIRNLPLTIESIFATPTDIYANVHFKTAEPVTAEVIYGPDRTQLNDPQRSFRVPAQLQPVAATGQSTVQVSSSDPVNLAANPLSVIAGETVTLRWQVGIATSNCTASWRSTSPGIAGTQTVNPTVTTTYTFSCIESNTGQQHTTNVTVRVLQPYGALVVALPPQLTLTPRTTYYYKIVATSLADPNRVAESAINEFTTLPTPTRNDMTASVTWTPSCAGTSGEVQYSRLPLNHPSANASTITASLGGGRYTAVITGLQNAVTYYYNAITQGGSCPAGGKVDQSGTFETPGG